MKKKDLTTEYHQKKEAKELAIFNDWTEMMAQPGAMSTTVDETIMSKYDIYSAATVWRIRQRVSKRLKDQKNEMDNNQNENA